MQKGSDKFTLELWLDESQIGNIHSENLCLHQTQKEKNSPFKRMVKAYPEYNTVCMI